MPEYLMALKLVAGRPKDEIDLKALIKCAEPALIKKTRSIIKRLLGAYAADDFDSFVMEAEMELARERR